MEVPPPGDQRVRFSCSAMLALSLVILTSVDLNEIQAYAKDLFWLRPIVHRNAGDAWLYSRDCEFLAFVLASVGVALNGAVIIATIVHRDVVARDGLNPAFFTVLLTPAASLVALASSVSPILFFVMIIPTLALIIWVEREARVAASEAAKKANEGDRPLDV